MTLWLSFWRGPRHPPFSTDASPVQAGGANRWQLSAGRCRDQQMHPCRPSRDCRRHPVPIGSLNRHVANAYKFDAFTQGGVDILAAEQTEHGATTGSAVRRTRFASA